MKVAIIGSGRIGSLIAFYLTVRDSIKEIVLIDKSREKADSDASDISYIPAVIGNAKLYAGGYETTADSNIVVIAAQSDPNNVEMQLQNVKEIVTNVMHFTQKAIFIIVSDPIDVLTYMVTKVTGLPRERVIGVGTYLDTIKLKSILAYKLGYTPINVDAMVIGEHGENMVALTEHINIHGLPIKSVKNIDKQLIKEALDSIRAKSGKEEAASSHFSSAVAVADIIEAIAYDERVLLPVSFLQQGEYGIENVALSLPAIIGERGIEDILEIDLAAEDRKRLELGAALLKAEIARYEKSN